MKQRDWKSRLYKSYVSTGQSTLGVGDIDSLLRIRAPWMQYVISRFFPANRESVVVDLGCGYGPLLHFLKDSGYTNLIGVESSDEQVQLSKQIGLNCVERSELMPWLLARDAQSLDVVCAVDVFEHLTRQEMFDALDEIVRVLRPGGTLLLHVPNAEGLFGMRMRYGDLTHEQAFTQYTMRQALNAVGFRTVECYGDKPLVHGVKSAVRAAIWWLVCLKLKLIHAAETGFFGIIPSQNITVIARK